VSFSVFENVDGDGHLANARELLVESVKEREASS
jgi:hypothetical protein